MIPEFITWNPDPEIFRIGGFAVRWYGLSWALSFFIGYLLMTNFYKKAGLTVEELDKLSLYVIIGAIAGARLGHVLFYQPGYYLSNPHEILFIWEGGLASHGGAIGILLAVWLFCRKKSTKPMMWVLDRLIIAVALGGFFIRMGNLMNSEMIGKVTDVSWAFIFKNIDEFPRHPAQLYEAIGYLGVFLLLLGIYTLRKGNPARGLLFGLFLSLLFTIRFLMEFFKEPQVDFEQAMLFNMGQILSIPFILIGIFILIRSLRANNE